MADINITVNNNLYSIVLDAWDWNGLTVNDNGNIQVIQKINGQWAYNQTTAGMIEFEASAAANTVQPVNPGATYIIKGNTRNHLCMISYTPSDPQNTFTLTAFCSDVSPYFPPNSTSPVLFSQVHMTGVFQQS